MATLTWSIVRTVPAYSNTLNKCALCLHERLEILMYPDPKNFWINVLKLCLDVRMKVNAIKQCNYDSKDWLIA